MKNKKSLLSLGLIALVLVLGVGYAVVSNVGLTISGDVSSNSDLKVSFKSATDSSDKVTATTTDGSLTATINVTDLSAVNETVTATYTIQNLETDVDAKVIEKSITILSKDGKNTDLSQYFEVTTDIDETNGLSINRKSEADVVVQVKLLETPLTAATSTAAVTIELEASAVVPSN